MLSFNKLSNGFARTSADLDGIAPIMHIAEALSFRIAPERR